MRTHGYARLLGLLASALILLCVPSNLNAQGKIKGIAYSIKESNGTTNIVEFKWNRDKSIIEQAGSPTQQNSPFALSFGFRPQGSTLPTPDKVAPNGMGFPDGAFSWKGTVYTNKVHGIEKEGTSYKAQEFETRGRFLDELGDPGFVESSGNAAPSPPAVSDVVYAGGSFYVYTLRNALRLHNGGRIAPESSKLIYDAAAGPKKRATHWVFDKAWYRITDLNGIELVPKTEFYSQGDSYHTTVGKLPTPAPTQIPDEAYYKRMKASDNPLLNTTKDNATPSFTFEKVADPTNDIIVEIIFQVADREKGDIQFSNPDAFKDTEVRLWGSDYALELINTAKLKADSYVPLSMPVGRELQFEDKTAIVAPKAEYHPYLGAYIAVKKPATGPLSRGLIYEGEAVDYIVKLPTSATDPKPQEWYLFVVQHNKSKVVAGKMVKVEWAKDGAAYKNLQVIKDGTPQTSPINVPEGTELTLKFEKQDCYGDDVRPRPMGGELTVEEGGDMTNGFKVKIHGFFRQFDFDGTPKQFDVTNIITAGEGYNLQCAEKANCGEDYRVVVNVTEGYKFTSVTIDGTTYNEGDAKITRQPDGKYLCTVPNIQKVINGVSATMAKVPKNKVATPPDCHIEREKGGQWVTLNTDEEVYEATLLRLFVLPKDCQSANEVKFDNKPLNLDPNGGGYYPFEMLNRAVEAADFAITYTTRKVNGAKLKVGDNPDYTITTTGDDEQECGKNEWNGTVTSKSTDQNVLKVTVKFSDGKPDQTFEFKDKPSTTATFKLQNIVADVSSIEVLLSVKPNYYTIAGAPAGAPYTLEMTVAGQPWEDKKGYPASSEVKLKVVWKNPQQHATKAILVQWEGNQFTRPEPDGDGYKLTLDKAIVGWNIEQAIRSYSLTYTASAPDDDYSLEVRTGAKEGTPVAAGSTVTLEYDTQVWIRVTTKPDAAPIASVNLVGATTTQAQPQGENWYMAKISDNVTGIEATSETCNPGEHILRFEKNALADDGREFQFEVKANGQPIESGKKFSAQEVELNVVGIDPTLHRVWGVTVNGAASAERTFPQKLTLADGEHCPSKLVPLVYRDWSHVTDPVVVTVRQLEGGHLKAEYDDEGTWREIRTGVAPRVTRGKNVRITLEPQPEHVVIYAPHNIDPSKVGETQDVVVSSEGNFFDLWAIFSKPYEKVTVTSSATKGGTLTVTNAKGETLEAEAVLFAGEEITIAATAEGGYKLVSLLCGADELLNGDAVDNLTPKYLLPVVKKVAIVAEFQRYTTAPDTSQLTPVRSELLSKVRLYPNPSDGLFYIEGAEALHSWLLLDASGRVVGQGIHQGGARIELRLPRAAGIYFLRLRDAEGATRTLRVIRR